MAVPFKRIVVYIDGSESSMTAIMYAIKLAKEHDSSLTAVYVINTKALSELVKAGIFVAVERDEYQRDSSSSMRSATSTTPSASPSRRISKSRPSSSRGRCTWW